jgi:hypothetical protein
MAIHYAKMTKTDLEAALKEALAERDKLAARGKVGFSIKFSDKLDDSGAQKIIVRVPGQRYPVTISAAAWRMIVSKQDEILAACDDVEKGAS